MNPIDDMELVDCIVAFGFSEGTKIYCLYVYKNLTFNKNKSWIKIESDLTKLLSTSLYLNDTSNKTYRKYKSIIDNLSSLDTKLQNKEI